MPTPLPTGFKHLAVAGAMLCAALLPQAAGAALGGPETAVATDAQQLRGSIKTTERTRYRVHEIQLASGTTVREFAVPGGSVFAVAWAGPRVPDMRQTLGAYFDAYVTAAQGKRLGRTHMEIRQSDWVMQAAGHMRAFQGRAYLPQFLPAGMSLDEIR